MQETSHFGVHYVVSSPQELVGFTDSDRDGDHIERKYALVYVSMLPYGPIFCSRKKQHTISFYSAEAEYRGAVHATTQRVLLQGII